MGRRFCGVVALVFAALLIAAGSAFAGDDSGIVRDGIDTQNNSRDGIDTRNNTRDGIDKSGIVKDGIDPNYDHKGITAEGIDRGDRNDADDDDAPAASDAPKN